MLRFTGFVHLHAWAARRRRIPLRRRSMAAARAGLGGGGGGGEEGHVASRKRGLAGAGPLALCLRRCWGGLVSTPRAFGNDFVSATGNDSCVGARVRPRRVTDAHHGELKYF